MRLFTFEQCRVEGAVRHNAPKACSAWLSWERLSCAFAQQGQVSPNTCAPSCQSCTWDPRIRAWICKNVQAPLGIAVLVALVESLASPIRQSAPWVDDAGVREGVYRRSTWQAES